MSSSRTNHIHAFPILCVMLVLMLASPAWSQHITTSRTSLNTQDTRATRAILKEWARSLKPFDKSRRTVVFTTSLQQCSGCCAAAVNDILAEIDRGKWNVNIVILIGMQFPEEVVTVRSLFKHPNVVADATGKGWRTLRAEQAAPCMFILGPNGEMLARWIDIQHNVVSRDILNALRWNLQEPSTLKPSWEVKLKESGENVIVDIDSPSSDGQSLLFLDPRANAIYRFSTLDGSLMTRETVDDSVTLRFRRAGDNPWVWSSMKEHISPLIKLYGAVAGPNGATRAIATFHTGYDSIVAPDGKKMFNLHKQIGVADIANGRVSSIVLLNEGRGYIGAPIALDSTANFVVTYFWDNGQPELSNQIKHDSGFALARSSIVDSRFVPLVSIDELERACNSTIDPNLSVLQCCGGGQTIFFYDGTNDILCRADTTSDPSRLKIFPLWNGPRVTSALSSNDESASAIPRRADTLISIGGMNDAGGAGNRAVMGIAWSSAYLDLVAIEEVNKRNVVSVRRVLPDGTIVREVALAHGNDIPVAAYPIGYRDGNLMVLVKWTRARWIISGLRL